MSIADNIIMLTANMTLEEHCHHTQNRIFFSQRYFLSYYAGTNKEKTKRKYRNGE